MVLLVRFVIHLVFEGFLELFSTIPDQLGFWKDFSWYFSKSCCQKLPIFWPTAGWFLSIKKNLVRFFEGFPEGFLIPRSQFPAIWDFKSIFEAFLQEFWPIVANILANWRLVFIHLKTNFGGIFQGIFADSSSFSILFQKIFPEDLLKNFEAFSPIFLLTFLVVSFISFIRFERTLERVLNGFIQQFLFQSICSWLSAQWLVDSHSVLTKFQRAFWADVAEQRGRDFH